MTLQQIKQQIAELVNGTDNNKRVMILNYCQNNDIRDLLEEMSKARQVNAVFQVTAAEEFKKNGKSVTTLQELREMCTPTSGTTFDYDSAKYSTLYTLDYILLPDLVAAIEYMATIFGKNYISVADYTPELPKPRFPGFEIITYNK